MDAINSIILRNNLFLQGKEFHLYYINSYTSPDYLHLYSPPLSPEELDRINHFVFKKDRITYTVSRGMLRYILGHYLHIKPENIIFSTGKYGKPFISEEQNLDNIQFNLSHSGNMIIYAISKDRNVGIDIQEIKENQEIAGIVEHYFSEAEIAEFAALPEEQKLNGFYSCWARKEALIKGTGLGLSSPLDSFTVQVKPDDYTGLLNDKNGTSWAIKDICISPEFTAAIALESNNHEFNYFIQELHAGDISSSPGQDITIGVQL